MPALHRLHQVVNWRQKIPLATHSESSQPPAALPQDPAKSALPGPNQPGELGKMQSPRAGTQQRNGRAGTQLKHQKINKDDSKKCNGYFSTALHSKMCSWPTKWPRSQPSRRATRVTVLWPSQHFLPLPKTAVCPPADSFCQPPKRFPSFVTLQATVWESGWSTQLNKSCI